MAKANREQLAWRTLNETQDELAALVAQNGGRLTPATLKAMYENAGKRDLFALLGDCWQILEPEMRRRFPDPRNFAHHVLSMAAIGRRLEV